MTSSSSESSSENESESKKNISSTKSIHLEKKSSSITSESEEEVVSLTKKQTDSSSESSSNEKESIKKELTIESDSDSSDESVEEKDLEQKNKKTKEINQELEIDTQVKDEKEKEIEFTTPKLVTSKLLFAWTMNTPEKDKFETSIGLKQKLDDSASNLPLEKKIVSKKLTKFNSKDHDLSTYRNAQLVGQTSTVFVKGIDINAQEEDIKAFFKDIESPLGIRYKYDENGEHPGFAFVTFSTPDLASRAVVEKNQEYICDRYVHTDWAEERKKSNNSTRGPKHADLKGSTTRVWVGNLHREVQDETLKEHFSSVGKLSDVYVIGRDESRPKIAYLSFSSIEDADKAVEQFQGSEIMGQNIRLDWAEERRNSGIQKRKRELSQKENGCVTIFVGGLTDSATEEGLTDIFKDCGEISQIRWIQKDDIFKGIAFIEFTETESTDKAIALNGIEYEGRSLRLDYAASRKKQF